MSKIYCAVWGFQEKMLLQNFMPFSLPENRIFYQKQRQNVKNKYFLNPPHSAVEFGPVAPSVKWH